LPPTLSALDAESYTADCTPPIVLVSCNLDSSVRASRVVRLLCSERESRRPIVILCGRLPLLTRRICQFKWKLSDLIINASPAAHVHAWDGTSGPELIESPSCQIKTKCVSSRIPAPDVRSIVMRTNQEGDTVCVNSRFHRPFTLHLYFPMWYG